MNVEIFCFIVIFYVANLVSLPIWKKEPWLELPKKTPNLHNIPYLQGGMFWSNFGLYAAINVQWLNNWTLYHVSQINIYKKSFDIFHFD